MVLIFSFLLCIELYFFQEGNTPMHYAYQNRHFEVVKTLLEFGGVLKGVPCIRTYIPVCILTN